MKGIERIKKDGFTVIGKKGLGRAEQGSEWVPPLWDQMNEEFDELIPVIKTDAEGPVLHMWGLMSDAETWLLPWQAEGLYLAGIEADPAAEAPHGFTKWEWPAFEYFTVKTDMDHYQEAMQVMMTEVLPDEGEKLVGPVIEFYRPSFAEDELMLYFPIKKL